MAANARGFGGQQDSAPARRNQRIDRAALDGDTVELRKLLRDTAPGAVATGRYLPDMVAAKGLVPILEILSSVVDYRYETRLVPTEQGVADAGGLGHLSVVKWAVETQNIIPPPGILQQAAENGHLPVVKYVLEILPGVLCSTQFMADSIAGAVRNENYDIAQLIIARKLE